MLKSISIDVTGMSCPHCEAAVVKAAESVQSVEKAKASAKKGVLKFKAPSEEVIPAVKSAVKEAGFEC